MAWKIVVDNTVCPFKYPAHDMTMCDITSFECCEKNCPRKRRNMSDKSGEVSDIVRQ